MASNKRPGRDLSPRDAQEHKKLKQISGDSSSKQKSQPMRKSGSSTPDGASTLADSIKASLSNRTTCNQPESRSSVSTSDSRSGSPVRRRSSKNIDNPAESSGRPPLRISTPNQATKGHSKVSAGPTSAKEASTSTNELISRPALKRANTASGAPSTKSSEDQNSVSLPPPRGPAPTAPMMGLSAAVIPTPTTASSAITPLTAMEAATPALTLATTESVKSLAHVFSDVFKLDVQCTQTALRMERLKERLERLQKQATTEGPAGIEAQILALQRNLKTVETEDRDNERRLLIHVGILESAMEGEVNNCISKGIGKVNDRVQALEERFQASEEKQSSRDAKLKATLSPLQMPDSTNDVISHDALETMVQRIVKTELAAKFKGPLAPIASLSNGSTPEESPAPVRAPKETSPNASAEAQSEMDKVRKDLEVFKQQICAKDKERDTKIEKLEQQNTQLKGQVTLLEGTKQRADNETSALRHSLTVLEKGKADQAEVSALKDEVTTISGKLDNALSISNVVTKFQAEVKAIKDESKPIWDELNRIKKDMNTTTDPRRRIFQSPTTATTDVNPRVDAIQRSVDVLCQRMDNLPAALGVSDLQTGAEKIKEDIREIKEDHGKVLVRLERHDERIDRHDERTERAERDLFSDNTRINEINQDLSNLDDQFAGLKRKVRHIDLDLDSLEKEVEDLPRANVDDSGKMEGEVKTRQVEITKIHDKMLRHDKEIKSLESNITQMSGKSTPGNNEAITARLDNLEAKQGSQQDSISTTAQSVEALERSAIDAKTHKKAMDNIERKFEQRHAALASPLDEIQRRFDIIEQEHSSLHDKVDNIDAKLEIADTERLRRDEMQRRFDKIEKEQSSMHGKIDNIDAKLGCADTEGQRRVDAIEKKQSSLQGKIDNIDVHLKTARERNESLLKSSDEHTKYINRLDRFLRGGDEFTNLETAFPRGAGLVQQLAELKSTAQAGRQLNRRQSTGNTAFAQQADTAQQTSAPELNTLERRVTQVEREYASLKTTAGGLRIDFDSFEESVAQQSELVEADVRQRVQDEVARALSSAHPPTQPTLTTEAVEHMIEELASTIRNEMQDLYQEATRRPVSPTLKEIEEAAFERMERSTSRIVTEKLDGANQRLDIFHDRLLTISDSVSRFDREYPAGSGCAETLADIVAFCRTYGKSSDFLKATLEAIRNLQGRFDNMLTHQLANHISNLLIPHINHKLVGPVRDAIAPIVSNDIRKNHRELSNDIRQSHRELSDKQQLLDMKLEELEQKVNMTSDAALQDELRQQSQEFLRSCATINERIDKDSRTTRDDFQKLWEMIDALKVDFGNDKSIIWENLREHRDNIERAQDDFGGIQACVVRIAKEVNKDLVPRDWLDLA